MSDGEQRRPRRRGAALAVTFWLCVVLCVPVALAQYAETTGNIQGNVRDPSGAVIPGASVELTSPALVAPRKVETDGAGFFRFPNLPPGEYALLASATGFKSEKRTLIRLEVGRTLTFDFSLQLGTVAEIIEVESAPLNIDVTSNKAAVNLTSDQIQYIPKGRNAFTILDLAPGARLEPLQGSARGDARGVAAGFQIDGSSDGENVYAVEGMDTTNIRAGGIGVNIPFDFVQEVQVKSSGFEAEYGGALGGVVNLVEKRGSNAWHGSGILYFRNQAFDSAPRGQLRLNPTYPLQTSAAIRLAEPAEYYQPKKDRYSYVEPGFDIGGPILTDKLWIYASYLPQMYRQTRSVNFCSTNCTSSQAFTPFSFTTRDTIHYALGRLDGQITSKVRANFGWHYAYRRREGDSVPQADSPYFDPNAADLNATLSGIQRLQFNPDSSRVPGSFRPDFGFVQPNSTYTVGGDWTITPRWVVTAKYGYWFSNNGDRGRPVGVRFLYDAATGATSTLSGTAIPTAVQGPSGFSNIPSNLQTIFDALTRHGFNVDSSYTQQWYGSHNFKVGYAFNRLGNNVRSVFNTSFVRINWNVDYTGLTITGAGQAFCATNSAQNQATYGQSVCRGEFGEYLVRDGVVTVGNVASYNHSLYFQDSWQVAKHVTLNLGVRFDKEYLPSFLQGSGAVQNPISFGFADKVAPRLGAAWDVFGGGKLKLYISWGRFYDIMKYEMPRGSFGGEYWHDCWFTLDTTDLTQINPQPDANGHVCPGSGGTPGQKIEEIDWRAVANSPTDNRVQPGIKPMRQTELVIGGEYALLRHLGVEVRYARKRLNRTIEDVGFFDALGENYFIGNPGEGILENPVSGVCPTCPQQPRPTRNYDGVEFKVRKSWSQNWFVEGSYTYSRLYGNYSGLTSTDELGRHSPNVNRFFDLPHMAWDASGRQVFGLLPTDRPHSFKVFGAYRLKWFGMETTLGMTQLAYSGTPVTTEIGVIGSSTSTSIVEGRGNFVDITRDPATGNWVSGAVRSGVRTEAFWNTDFLLIHEFRLSKTNENLRLALEWNASNIFNVNTTLAVSNRAPRTGVLTFPNPANTSDPIPCWSCFFAGFDYIARANGSNPTGTVLTLDNRYGRDSVFQVPRSMRLKVKVTF